MLSICKQFYLTQSVLALFVISLIAPVSVDARTIDKRSDGIIICTTTGLKLLTPSGKIKPVGQRDIWLSSEHCDACFTSGFNGDVDRTATSLEILTRTFAKQKKPVYRFLTSSLLTKSVVGARAPPV